MPTETTNYSFYLPLVNNATDQDLWGGYLNTNFTDLDSLLPQLVPSGQISAFPATVAPTGFLECNGQLISRTTYANLFNFANNSGNIQSDSTWTAGGYEGAFSYGDGSTTFRLPLLRGSFLRGWDPAGAIAPQDIPIGTYLADQIGSHTHSLPINSGIYVPFQTNPSGVEAPYYYSGVTGAFGGNETRPKGCAVLWAIKT